jgi:uridine phosphorylase
MQRIADSELIINARGGIYHLNLRPEELAPTVITVGDPERVRAVSKFFDKIELKQQHREFVSHTGLLAHKRITVLSTGIGPDNIDISLNELDALINIDFENRTVREPLRSLNIIRIGTSGALQSNIPVDSFVASSYAIGLDNLLNFYRPEYNDIEKQLLHSFITHTQLHGQISHPYISSGSASLLKHFVHDFHHGITVTCPGFYAPQGRVLRLGIKNPDLINRLTHFNFGQYNITNFEMETAAIYGLGRLLGHQCISLSAIVANRIEKQFSSDSNALMEKLIKKSIEIISTLP